MLNVYFLVLLKISALDKNVTLKQLFHPIKLLNEFLGNKLPNTEENNQLID